MQRVSAQAWGRLPPAGVSEWGHTQWQCAAYRGTHHCLTLLQSVTPMLQVHAGLVLRGGMRQAGVAVPQAAVSCVSGSCRMRLMCLMHGQLEAV